MSRLPNLYVPGFPKAGTTTVCAALGAHPAVFAPYTKEPHHWATDMPFYAEREGTSDREGYLSVYERRSEKHSYALDGSTLYLYSEAAISTIAAAVPDARFIVCLREVRSMIPAWHGQMLAGGYEDLVSLDRAWEASEDRRSGERIPQGCPDPRLLDYRRIGAQGEQIERLLRHVPAASVFVVRMEDLAADFAAAVSQCLEFLGLDATDPVTAGSRNASFSVRYRWLRRLLYSPPVKRSMNRALNAIGPTVASSLRDLARRVVYRSADRERPDEATLALIQEHFADDQVLLEDLLEGLRCTSARPGTAA